MKFWVKHSKPDFWMTSSVAIVDSLVFWQSVFWQLYFWQSVAQHQAQRSFEVVFLYSSNVQSAGTLKIFLKLGETKVPLMLSNF